MAKRIVLISGLKIFPNLSGGHLRTGGVAKGLARLGHSVKIFSLAGRRGDYGLGEGFLEQHIERGLVEEVHLGLIQGILQAGARRLGLPRIWQYLLLRLAWWPRRLRATLAEADLVICDLPYTAPPILNFHSSPWWLLSHNLEFRLLEQGTSIERWLAPWMRAIERRAPDRFRSILACAPEDRDFFRSLSSRDLCSVVQLGNGIDPEVYQKAQYERKSLRNSWGLSDDDWLIVFSGSRFQPNLEAMSELRAFCRREQQFLAERRIHFLLLGSLFPEASREGRLITSGPVADTVPYFAAADAALNPVRRGSGSNLKIFEYMAARLPIITTGFGMRGTELDANTECMMFDSDQELRAALDKLIGQPDREAWRQHSEAVWQKHGKKCDITELVRQAWDEILTVS